MDGNTNEPKYLHAIPNDAWKLQDAKRRYKLARFLEERERPTITKKKKKKRRVIKDYSKREVHVQSYDHKVTLIPDDLLFKILILLPAESLLQFVCKQWFNLINSSIFIRSHAHRSAETVLICRMLTLSKPVKRAKPKSYFHLLNLDGAAGTSFIESSSVEPIDILATCDGLVLAEAGKKNKRLILTNPVTRKHVVLPSLNLINQESFGVAFCKERNTFKIIHLFCDIKIMRRSGCSIMSVCEGRWAQIEAPDHQFLIDYNMKNPVPIGGSMYWTPWKRGCDRLLSFDLNHEKFLVSKRLPVSCDGFGDRLLEIEGSLGFVTNLRYLKMEVWIMISDENWIKKYIVDVCSYRVRHIPLCCLRDGKGMVIELGRELVVHKFERGEFEVIDTGGLHLFEGISQIVFWLCEGKGSYKALRRQGNRDYSVLMPNAIPTAEIMC